MGSLEQSSDLCEPEINDLLFLQVCAKISSKMADNLKKTNRKEKIASAAARKRAVEQVKWDQTAVIKKREEARRILEMMKGERFNQDQNFRGLQIRRPIKRFIPG